DVVVVGAALAMEIKHATGACGAGVELDLAGLYGEGEAPLGRHHVDPLVDTACTRVAEVVAVRDGAEHREADLLGRSRARPGREGYEEKDEKSESSGCRPAAGHGLRSCAKGRRLPECLRRDPRGPSVESRAA